MTGKPPSRRTMEMIRPRGGRANPRAIERREKAQNRMARMIDKGRTDEDPSPAAPMTPEMRVGYLRAKLERLEDERTDLRRSDRSVRARLLVMPDLDRRIREIEGEVVSILMGIAEGTLPENRTEYEVEAFDLGRMSA